MKVLVTGADGFIGSHTVEALVEAGHDVLATALYVSDGSWGWLDSLDAGILREIEVVAGDIRDPGYVSRVVGRCESVIHLAALIAIPYSYVAPDSYVQTNVGGTLNVLNACRDHGVTRLVHASTSEVYGTARYVPIDEDHPLQAQSPYSATKMGADHLVNAYVNSFNLPGLTIRPFNTYGPRQSARAVIPTVITQIARGSRSVELGATSPTRDFSFVRDTARGFIAGLGADETCFGEVFNLGMGTEISVGDVTRMIADLMDVDVEIHEVDQRQRPANSEVERLLSDNTKAKARLGWTPEFDGLAGLERGLRATIDWFCEPGNLAHYPRSGYVV